MAAEHSPTCRTEVELNTWGPWHLPLAINFRIESPASSPVRRGHERCIASLVLARLPVVLIRSALTRTKRLNELQDLEAVLVAEAAHENAQHHRTTFVVTVY
jgi:hypothetical protein